MEKELIITALIVVVIYLAYHQQENNQSPHIIESPNTQQLRSEVNYYQTLYEKQVEKEVDSEAQIKNLIEQLTILEEIINTPCLDAETQTDLSKKDISLSVMEKNHYQKLSTKLSQELEHYKNLSEKRGKELLFLVKQLKAKNQENDKQLRKINALFNKQANEEEEIDFYQIYELLRKIAKK